MQNANQNSFLKQFINNQAGETPTRMALMFAAAAVLGTVLFIPMIESATQKIVQNGLGVDYMTTASTRKPSTKYIIRKSILNQNDSYICLKGEHEKCEGAGN